MDLTPFIAPLLAGNSPWMIAAGVLLTVLYNRFLGKQPAPAPQPGPTPPPAPTGRPLIDLLGKLLGRVLTPTPAPAAAPPVGPITAAAAATLAGLSLNDLAQLRDTIGAEWAARVADLRRHLDASPAEPASPVK